ncbi:MAG: phosphoadenylyl-sulfate reductase [Proteobacteria bacterium]|nr:phosphoadenylyl-sulfate reductase [Pseudomonadota bacterium]
MTLFEAPASAASGPAAAGHSAPQHALAVALDHKLAGLTTLDERLATIRSAIEGTIAFSTSLGIEDQAITHAIASTGTDIDIFTLDTGRHFPETLDTLFDTEGKYGIKIRVMFPNAAEVEDLVANDGVYGFRYSVDARKACCEIRKVRPLNRALKGAAAWVTGLRREQSQGRSHVPFASYDAAQNLIKLNPIADWTLAQLEDYVAANKIPVNALHAKGFPSIGCQPCTRAIAPGEDIRAGRWWWENENGKECGLHTQSEDPGFEPKDRAA